MVLGVFVELMPWSTDDSVGVVDFFFWGGEFEYEWFEFSPSGPFVVDHVVDDVVECEFDGVYGVCV